MSRVTVTRSIEAHAVDVWCRLTDLTVRTRATRGVEVLTPGGFGPGTAWREVRSQPDGSALIEEFVVVDVEPPRRLVLSSPGAGVDYRVTWTLRPVPRRGRTIVTVTQEALPSASYGRVVALFLGGLAARVVESALRRDLADLAAATRATDAA